MRKGRPIDRKRVLLTGDFIKFDICGGMEFGYQTAPVLTGVTTSQMLDRSPVKPDLVFDQLGPG